MPRVHNDAAELGCAADSLRAFRAAVAEGESMVRGQLIALEDSWSDARYDQFRERLLGTLDVIRLANESELEAFEQRLYALREKLLHYLDENLRGRRQTVTSAIAGAHGRLAAQLSEYKLALTGGRLRIAERDVKQPIAVFRIAPPQNDPNFRWDHHGNSRDVYMELAETFAEITPLVRQGRSPDELRQQSDRYRRAVDAFWSRSDPIRVTRYCDIYVVEGGLHRVAAVIETGRSDALEAFVTTVTT